MSTPLFELGDPAGWQSLACAVGIGAIFGWFLERGGLGNARKLAGQFYLTDFTVVKVMFSAIVTAMLGLFWLSWLGWLDLSRIYVPETFIVPQLAGGLIFGAGFVLAGLCPGTSCVAAATGRRDGLAAVVGMLAGVMLFAELFPVLREFHASTSRGSLTVPVALGLPYGVVVFAIVCLALVAFRMSDLLEARARGERSAGGGTDDRVWREPAVVANFSRR
jgi:uncharacterized protein